MKAEAEKNLISKEKAEQKHKDSLGTFKQFSLIISQGPRREERKLSGDLIIKSFIGQKGFHLGDDKELWGP